MFWTINEHDTDLKEWCFLPKHMVTKKMCDTNKNVTKMGDYNRGLLYILSYNKCKYKNSKFG
jgi:hypothetical protein